MARNPLNRLTGSKRNAGAALIKLFQGFDLGSLAEEIVRMIKDGLSQDAIYLELQETKVWKQRFRGNELRLKKGLSVLTPAEYLATERSYRQILQQYGMPKGFYDTHDDFAGMIGGDLSASELQGRVEAVVQFTTTQDSATLDALRKFGLGKGDLAAYALDRKRALPLLERTMRAVALSSEAVRAGLKSSKDRALQLADMGVTQEGAAQGYREIARTLPNMSDLADVYGRNYGQSDAEKAIFEGDESSIRKQRKLQSQERATWTGSSRGSSGSASKSTSY